MLNWVLNAPIENVWPVLAAISLVGFSLIFNLTMRVIWNIHSGRSWYNLRFK
jgi:hypothetical protein